MDLTDIANFLGAERYSQHSLCLTNDPLMLIAYVGSDMTIFFSYMVLGLSLLLRRNHVIQLGSQAVLLYGTFIFLCGLTHLTSTIVLFSGVYRLDVGIKALTASVSAVTAAYTIFGTVHAPRPDQS